jgi:hypothetical protein
MAGFSTSADAMKRFSIVFHGARPDGNKKTTVIKISNPGNQKFRLAKRPWRGENK